MSLIQSCSLPENALLQHYRKSGAYTDCYCTEIPNAITHSQYIQAFYTTSLFKLERFILKWLVAKPSSDAQVTLLAIGETEDFAAWSVENRCNNQLLLCDYQKRTRSWLMIEQIKDVSGSKTKLYFGSAVVPKEVSKSAVPSFGLVFHALSWFHKIYSVALLRSAKSRLIKTLAMDVK